jgi:hypothetical protein
MKRKMKYSSREQKKLRTICAWCGKKMPSDLPAYTVDGVFKPGVDFSDAEGTFIPVHFLATDEVLPMFVTPSWSQANQEGKDFIYLVCSEECGKCLREALAEDKKNAEMVNSLFSSN